MDPDDTGEQSADLDTPGPEISLPPNNSRGYSVQPLKAAYQKVESDFGKLQKAQIDRELQVSKKLEDLAASMVKKMEEKMNEMTRNVTDQVQGLEERMGRIEAALGISPNGTGGMGAMGPMGGMGPMGMMGGMGGMGGMGMMGGMGGMGMMGGMGGMGGMGLRGPGAGAALMAAVQTGNLEQLRVMLAQGADPNARDANGSTALHLAAQMNNEMMVRLLLSAGACKNATDAQGRMPFHLATVNMVRGLLCC